MPRDAADWLMIALGLVSGALLLLLGTSFTISSPGTASLSWIFVVAFLAYIGWDVLRHARAIASRSRSLRPRGP